jgi:hypothetical protein
MLYGIVFYGIKIDPFPMKEYQMQHAKCHPDKIGRFPIAQFMKMHSRYTSLNSN